MTQYLGAWQCNGCGKIEAPQCCIGVCRDRKILMIGKADHEQVIEELLRVREKTLAAPGLLSRLALSTPCDGQWESSNRVMQEQARAALATLTPTEVQGTTVC